MAQGLRDGDAFRGLMFTSMNPHVIFFFSRWLLLYSLYHYLKSFQKSFYFPPRKVSVELAPGMK